MMTYNEFLREMDINPDCRAFCMEFKEATASPVFGNLMKLIAATPESKLEEVQGELLKILQGSPTNERMEK